MEYMTNSSVMKPAVFLSEKKARCKPRDACLCDFDEYLEYGARPDPEKEGGSQGGVREPADPSAEDRGRSGERSEGDLPYRVGPSHHEHLPEIVHADPQGDRKGESHRPRRVFACRIFLLFLSPYSKEDEKSRGEPESEKKEMRIRALSSRSSGPSGSISKPQNASLSWT